ncbi:MATE family efflux transporter [Nonomuraea fuscirosea]|uniref:MATE family efflux transporter n=1 Tax=Nonomuraea fuscirosea TaxID=1291556 RepID=UPI002DD8512D|nr:MATE family efflux transporter [Nonomuraea fuscirosea]WSA48899.1 MATE family efflux transporter [Nonomuraea fuscirosea]
MSADTASDARTPVRQIAALGLPFLLGAFLSSVSGVIDTAMMGRFGSAELAAVSGASAVFDVFSGVVLATVVGHQILAARFAGRDDPAGLRRSLRSSMWYCGAFAVPLTLLCLFAGGRLTGLISDGDGGVSVLGADYLLARGPSLLLLVPFSLLAATFNAYKRPRYATVASVVINVANILLDWLLIYGPGPFPRLGATGNGLATTISWLLGIGCLLVAARRFRLAELLRRPGPGGPVDFETSIPKLGWPAVVSMGLDYSSNAIFFAIIGGLGQAALGGGRIAFQMMVLLYGVGTAFSAAARILIGRAAGAGEVGDLPVLWRGSRLLLMPPALVVGVVLVVAPGPAASLFTSFPDVLRDGAAAMPLIGLCLPLIAWTLGNVSVLRALGQTRSDMYGNLVAALCVQLPVSWLLASVAGLGIAGAYAGVVGYWLVRGALTEFLARARIRHETRAAAVARDGGALESAASDPGARPA